MSDACVVEKDQRLTVGYDSFERAVNRWVDHGSIEIAHSLDRNFRRHLFLVWASRRQRVIDLYGSDDPGAQRNGFAGQPVRIAQAVPALVVAAHESDHVFQVDQRRQNLRSHGHVLLDVLVLFVGQRTLLVEDLLANSDLADIMQPAAGANRLDLLVRAAILRRHHGG